MLAGKLAVRVRASQIQQLQENSDQVIVRTRVPSKVRQMLEQSLKYNSSLAFDWSNVSQSHRSYITDITITSPKSYSFCASHSIQDINLSWLKRENDDSSKRLTVLHQEPVSSVIHKLMPLLIFWRINIGKVSSLRGSMRIRDTRPSGNQLQD